jgi:hypothetical protein
MRRQGAGTRQRDGELTELDAHVEADQGQHQRLLGQAEGWGVGRRVQEDAAETQGDGRGAAPGDRENSIERELRYLVPKMRSPASPSPGRM